RIDSVGDIDDRRAVAQPHDGVLAVVIAVDEAPYVRGRRGTARELRERNLRLEIEVAARELARHALHAWRGRGLCLLQRRAARQRDLIALRGSHARGPVETPDGERIAIPSVDADDDRLHFERPRFVVVISFAVAAR